MIDKKVWYKCKESGLMKKGTLLTISIENYMIGSHVSEITKCAIQNDTGKIEIVRSEDVIIIGEEHE